MIDRLLVKLRHYDVVSAEEEKMLRAAASEQQSFRRGQTIVLARTDLTYSSLVVEGLVHSFKTIATGQRQAVQFAVPGDFIDLHSLPMKSIDHDLVAMTDCQLVKFPHHRLTEITRTHD